MQQRPLAARLLGLTAANLVEPRIAVPIRQTHLGPSLGLHHELNLKIAIHDYLLRYSRTRKTLGHYDAASTVEAPIRSIHQIR